MNKKQELIEYVIGNEFITKPSLQDKFTKLLDEALAEQLILHGVSKSLKDKHAQALFEYKQQLKETDNDDTLFIDNKEEWIRQTSILEGKIGVLESL